MFVKPHTHTITYRTRCVVECVCRGGVLPGRVRSNAHACVSRTAATHTDNTDIINIIIIIIIVIIIIIIDVNTDIVINTDIVTNNTHSVDRNCVSRVCECVCGVFGAAHRAVVSLATHTHMYVYV